MRPWYRELHTTDLVTKGIDFAAMTETKLPGREARAFKPRGPNKLGKDLRAVIEQAFHKAGGRDYLVQIAHKRPDVFLALVGKIIPQETRLSVMASYQAMPIPVEARDALPVIEHQTHGDTLTAVYDVIGEGRQPEPLPAPLASAGDDWLDS
jgi:hypothetical protein